ncbi:MAG TPA: glycoside hydrolase [Deltaproteobacteria bacterium]|nr:glycoside hydrolase [Deltaproteobacteria bacterium]
MIIKKQYLKSRPVCKVTFRLPADIGNTAKQAALVGEFNNWDMTANPMKRLQDGAFTVTIDLEKDREYQFRYLLDGTQWENAVNADRHEATPFGDSFNSIVIV